MTNLPEPGHDNDTWGDMLNDFLRVSHREDGTLRGIIDVVNVLDFGATGDGEADDAPAIQAALDAAPERGMVYLPLPPDKYKITRSIVIKKSVRFVGGGILPIIQLDNDDQPVIVVDAPEVSYVCLDNLWLIGGSKGIDLTGNNLSGLSRFRTLLITGCIEAAIDIRTGMIGAQFENIQIGSSPDYGIRCLNAIFVNGVRFVGVRIVSTDVAAVYFEHPAPSAITGIVFVSPILEGNRGAGFVLKGGFTMSIYDAHFEKNGKARGEPDIDLASNEQLRAICDLHLFRGQFSGPSQVQLDNNRVRIKFSTHHVSLSLFGTKINHVEVIDANNQGAGVTISFLNVITEPKVINLATSSQSTLRFGHMKLGRGLSTAGVSSLDGLPEDNYAYNLRGLLTISGDNPAGSAEFDRKEPNDAYFLTVTPTSRSGTPAAGSNHISWIEKTAEGFTVHLETAPGEGNSVTFDWHLIR